jgi:hypothetical protein
MNSIPKGQFDRSPVEEFESELKISNFTHVYMLVFNSLHGHLVQLNIEPGRACCSSGADWLLFSAD